MVHKATFARLNERQQGFVLAFEGALVRANTKKSTVAEAMEMHYQTFRKRVAEPDSLTVGELRKLIRMLNLSRADVNDLVWGRD